MKLLLATNHLGLGGSESYLLTVAEQLDRLGHEVAIYAPELGGGLGVAEERGLRVLGEGSLAGEFDAALVQDGGVSLQIAELCPGVRQLFVAHSEIFDLQAPPQLDGSVAAAVALNDRVLERLRRYAVEVELVRLRQPIDTQRFAARGPLPEAARSALLLSNTPHADRVAMIEASCAAAGLELKRVGGIAGRSADIRPDLAAADIVIGYGRSILEAMACGRAAYVYDWHGGDGWVTEESYARIEADGFAGRTGKIVLDPARLAEDLRRYTPSMGPVNHDLVMGHHRASRHAEQLVELLARLRPPKRRAREQLQEMARLIRLEWRAQLDVQALRTENQALRELLDQSERARLRGQEEAETVARAATEQRRAFEESLSWRLTAPLRSLGRGLRRLLGH